MTWFNYLEYLCFAIAAEFEFHNGSTRMATPYLLDYIKNTLKKKMQFVQNGIRML